MKPELEQEILDYLKDNIDDVCTRNLYERVKKEIGDRKKDSDINDLEKFRILTKEKNNISDHIANNKAAIKILRNKILTLQKESNNIETEIEKLFDAVSSKRKFNIGDVVMYRNEIGKIVFFKLDTKTMGILYDIKYPDNTRLNKIPEYKIS